jgi:thioredoxin reductase (NADPH)
MATTNPRPPVPAPWTASEERLFPTLSPAQVARIATHGRVRRVQAGDVLLDVTDRLALRRRIGRDRGRPRPRRRRGEWPSSADHSQASEPVSGRRALVRIRASESGEVIEVDRDQGLALVQTDSELGEVLMRAFILRRAELIARGIGDVVLVGSSHCAGTLRVKEFLTRNGNR